MKLSAIVGVVFAFLLIPLLALAQAPLPDPGSDVLSFLSGLVKAVLSKNWTVTLALATSGLVFTAKVYGPRIPKLGPKLSAFLASDPGGVVLAFLTGFALRLWQAGSATLTLSLLWNAAQVSCGAITFFVIVKKFLLPVGTWLLARFFPSGAKQAEAIRAAGDATAVEAAAKATGDARSATDVLKGIR